MSWWLIGLLFIAGLIILQTLLAARSLAPWVPTRKKDLVRIRRLATQSKVFYELGSGTARVSRYMAKVGNTVVAVEKSALLFFAAITLRSLFSSATAYRILLADLYAVTLSDADCIYVFGMPASLTIRFCEKLRKECRPGTKVLSYCFPVTGLNQTGFDQPHPDDFPIFIYTI